MLRCVITFSFAICLLACVEGADAHSGRRLLVEVVDGKLQAQGVNTGPDDGAPALRPYLNAIHDHWQNVPALVEATASLPGFDIGPSASLPLLGHALDLELIGASKWVSPPMMPSPATIPVLEPLDASQLITIVAPIGETDTNALGTVRLTDDVPFGGLADIDLVYGIDGFPAGEIHVLEYLLHATPNGAGVSAVESSDSIYVLLSPDGSTPQERLHHASLFLEEYLATVPEPGTLSLAFATLAMASYRRPRRL